MCVVECFTVSTLDLKGSINYCQVDILLTAQKVYDALNTYLKSYKNFTIIQVFMQAAKKYSNLSLNCNPLEETTSILFPTAFTHKDCEVIDEI